MTDFTCDICNAPLDPNDESIYSTLTNFWLCPECLADEEDALEELVQC